MTTYTLEIKKADDEAVTLRIVYSQTFGEDFDMTRVIASANGFNPRRRNAQPAKRERKPAQRELPGA